MPDFNAMVSMYERLVEPLTRQFCLQAAELAGVGNGERVIDVATGTGALALAAAERGAIVLATDVAPAMAARAGERLLRFAGCRAEPMDCAALRVEDGSFDAAFSIFGVMLLGGWREGLGELVRVVRPGGRVVLGAWPDPEGALPMVVVARVFATVFPERTLWGDDGLNSSSAASLEAALKAAGCAEVAVHAVQAVHRASSVDAMLTDGEPMFRITPGYGGLTDAERVQMAEPLRAAFMAYAGTDGRVAMTVPALIAVGRTAS